MLPIEEIDEDESDLGNDNLLNYNFNNANINEQASNRPYIRSEISDEKFNELNDSVLKV